MSGSVGLWRGGVGPGGMRVGAGGVVWRWQVFVECMVGLDVIVVEEGFCWVRVMCCVWFRGVVYRVFYYGGWAVVGCLVVC